MYWEKDQQKNISIKKDTYTKNKIKPEWYLFYGISKIDSNRPCIMTENVSSKTVSFLCTSIPIRIAATHIWWIHVVVGTCIEWEKFFAVQVHFPIVWSSSCFDSKESSLFRKYQVHLYVNNLLLCSILCRFSSVALFSFAILWMDNIFVTKINKLYCSALVNDEYLSFFLSTRRAYKSHWHNLFRHS